MGLLSSSPVGAAAGGEGGGRHQRCLTLEEEAAAAVAGRLAVYARAPFAERTPSAEAAWQLRARALEAAAEGGGGAPPVPRLSAAVAAVSERWLRL